MSLKKFSHSIHNSVKKPKSDLSELLNSIICVIQNLLIVLQPLGLLTMNYTKISVNSYIQTSNFYIICCSSNSQL